MPRRAAMHRAPTIQRRELFRSTWIPSGLFATSIVALVDVEISLDLGDSNSGTKSLENILRSKFSLKGNCSIALLWTAVPSESRANSDADHGLQVSMTTKKPPLSEKAGRCR